MPLIGPSEEEYPIYSESFDWNGIAPLAPIVSSRDMGYWDTAPTHIHIVTVQGACPTTPITWEINWASYRAWDDPPAVAKQRFHFLWKWMNGEDNFPSTMPPVGWDENFFWVGSHGSPMYVESYLLDTGVIEVCALQNGSLLQKTLVSNLEYSTYVDYVYPEIERISVYSSFSDYISGETM